VLAIFAPSAAAMYLPTRIAHVPIKRLIENLTQEKAADPKAAPQIEFRLGRLFAMAYAMDTENIPVCEVIPPYDVSHRKELQNQLAYPGYPVSSWPPYRQLKLDATRTTPSAVRALSTAIEHFRLVFRLAPNDDVKLGLAWCLVEAGQKAEATALLREIERVPIQPRDGSYFGRFTESERRSYEAAQYLIGLLDPKTDAKELAELRKKPKPNYEPQVETPIVIPLESGLTASDIMQNAAVKFDLCFGARRYSTWPSAKAGWLVYDKDDAGDIRSGLQMFGSYSFFLFWRNGYEVLSALDDNHDGKLDGAELQYLAIWQDRNCDGKSDKSEVLPLCELGITALSCSSAVDADGILSSEHGVSFISGETRKTYDFVLHDQSE
jgi:hypothetical protein